MAPNPDAMGRALIGRQLGATVADASAKAATLEMLALRFDGLSSYSAQQSDSEGAPNIAAGYVATCPNSAGPGVGTISKWRKATGADATARATSLRSAATSARRAASDANRTAQSYSLSTHDQSMRQLSDEVAAISAASMAADRLGMATMVNELDAATREGGVCPEAVLQGLISNVREVPLGPLDHGAAFTAPPRPSEAEAVADLWTQVIKLRKGEEADFSLYTFPLLLSPFLDLVLMTMLGMTLPQRRADDDDAVIATRMGIDPDEAPLLDDAISAVAVDPTWTDLVGKVEDAGRRWLRVKRIIIHKDDWANLHRMRHLVELGRVYDGGMVEDHQVYVLRPRFLFERFDQLVRKRIIESRVRRVATGPTARAKLVRIVREAPEVVVKVTGRQRGGSHVKAHLKYIGRKGDLEIEARDGEILISKDDIAERAAEWSDSHQWRSRPTVSSVSLIFSMPEGTDPDKVLGAVRALAHAELSDNRDHVLALHTDTPRPHLHLTVQAEGLDRKRFNPRPVQLNRFRERFARELRARGQGIAGSSMALVKIRARLRTEGSRQITNADRRTNEQAIAVARGQAALPTFIARGTERWQKIRVAYSQAVAELDATGADEDRELASDVRGFLDKRQGMNTTPGVFSARHAQSLNRGVPPTDVMSPDRDRNR